MSATGAKRHSLPLEAVTIFNEQVTPMTDAVAYYRTPDCTDTKGLGPDFLVVLDPINLAGVNVVDLKLPGRTTLGAPLSFRAVTLARYASAIYDKTGWAPRINTVYMWNSVGVLTGFKETPGTVQNVQLRDYATPDELMNMSQGSEAVAEVLGKITEIILNKDSERGSKIKEYLGIKPSPQNSAKTPEDRSRRKQQTGRSNVPSQQSFPTKPKPPDVPSPQEIANRPINYEALASQCLQSGNPLLWCQRYLAAHAYSKRLAKAAFDVFQLTTKGTKPQSQVAFPDFQNNQGLINNIQQEQELSQVRLEMSPPKPSPIISAPKSIPSVGQEGTTNPWANVRVNVADDYKKYDLTNMPPPNVFLSRAPNGFESGYQPGYAAGLIQDNKVPDFQADTESPKTKTLWEQEIDSDIEIFATDYYNYLHDAGPKRVKKDET
ncbi:hypothetical protein ABW20_dc0108044 [Dactylellina cionopaga]|nr:hypothetical protein ABW20_dc0108044 [Dactylellina cionopaga]